MGRRRQGRGLNLEDPAVGRGEQKPLLDGISRGNHLLEELPEIWIPE